MHLKQEPSMSEELMELIRKVPLTVLHAVAFSVISFVVYNTLGIYEDASPGFLMMLVILALYTMLVSDLIILLFRWIAVVPLFLTTSVVIFTTIQAGPILYNLR